MGDWIKNNQYTAAVLTSLILFAILSMVAIKPYVDSRDSNIVDDFNVKMDTLIKVSSETNYELRKLNDIWEKNP